MIRPRGTRTNGARAVRASTLRAVSESAERTTAYSLNVDEGVVLLRWTPGVHITGPLAAEAMTTVDQLNGDHTRPLLVDMTGTGKLTREARETFRRKCQVSRMALVGQSAVDRVIASFGLRVTTIATPARFFVDVPTAMTWLREANSANL